MIVIREIFCMNLTNEFEKQHYQWRVVLPTMLIIKTLLIRLLINGKDS
jgi:hypothetical protein